MLERCDIRDIFFKVHMLELNEDIIYSPKYREVNVTEV